MIELRVVVILAELAVWLIVFFKAMKSGVYKAILLADFVVTTIDFVLLLTPLRTVLVYIVLYSKHSGKVIAKLPVTLGAALLVKTALFYLGQEVFPELPRQLDNLFSSGEVKRDEREERFAGNNNR